MSGLTRQGRICRGGGQDLLPASSAWAASGTAQARTAPWELGRNLCPFTAKLNRPQSLPQHFLFLLMATAVSQLPQHVPVPVLSRTHSGPLRLGNSLGSREPSVLLVKHADPAAKGQVSQAGSML